MDCKQTAKELQVDLETLSRMFFKVLDHLIEDNRKLKIKAFKPSKEMAKLYSDYLNWEDSPAKSNFEEIYKNELKVVEEWLKLYCEENDCATEEALCTFGTNPINQNRLKGM